MHLDTSRPHQATLGYTRQLGIAKTQTDNHQCMWTQLGHIRERHLYSSESVRGISLPGLIRFQKSNSLIILWPLGDGISLETSKNLQLVGELICNRLAARCFWGRCQDLQNTEKRHTVAGDLLTISTLLCTCFSPMISTQMSQCHRLPVLLTVS